MAGHVGQRLLADAVQRQRQGLRQHQRLRRRTGRPGPGLASRVFGLQVQAVVGGGGVETGRCRRPAGHQGAQQRTHPAQRLARSVAVLPRLHRAKRQQPQQQRADVLLDQLALAGHAGHHRRRLGLVRQAPRQPGGVHPQRGQALAKLVMQLARQPGPLVLLQREQLLAQQAAPVFGLVQRAGQVAQRGSQQRQLMDRHCRQRQHGLRVAALDAADGCQQPAQRGQRPAQVPAHRQQQAGNAGQQQRQRAQQVDHRLAPLALVRRRQAHLPVRAVGPGQRPGHWARLGRGQQPAVQRQQPAQRRRAGRQCGRRQQQPAVGGLHLQQQVAWRRVRGQRAQCGQRGGVGQGTQLAQLAELRHQLGQRAGGLELVVDVGVHALQAQAQRQQQHAGRHRHGALHQQAWQGDGRLGRDGWQARAHQRCCQRSDSRPLRGEPGSKKRWLASLTITLPA